MWASQLLTIRSINGHVDIIATFAFNVIIERVEMLMFTCSVVSQYIHLFGRPNTTGYTTTKLLGSVTSCDSLVRVCISVNTSRFTRDFNEIYL